MAASKARTHIYRVEDKPRSLLVRGLHHQIEIVRSLLKEIFIEEEIKIKKKPTIFAPQEIIYSSLTKPTNTSESRPVIIFIFNVAILVDIKQISYRRLWWKAKRDTSDL